MSCWLETKGMSQEAAPAGAAAQLPSVGEVDGLAEGLSALDAVTFAEAGGTLPHPAVATSPITIAPQANHRVLMVNKDCTGP